MHSPVAENAFVLELQGMAKLGFVIPGLLGAAAGAGLNKEDRPRGAVLTGLGAAGGSVAGGLVGGLAPAIVGSLIAAKMLRKHIGAAADTLLPELAKDVAHGGLGAQNAERRAVSSGLPPELAKKVVGVMAGTSIASALGGSAGSWGGAAVGGRYGYKKSLNH